MPDYRAALQISWRLLALSPPIIMAAWIDL